MSTRPRANKHLSFEECFLSLVVVEDNMKRDRVPYVRAVWNHMYDYIEAIDAAKDIILTLFEIRRLEMITASQMSLLLLHFS